MKKISQKDLDRLTKDNGWKLTPDSKREVGEQNKAAMLAKEVKAITMLSNSVDGVRDAVRAGKTEGRDYTDVVNRLIASIKEMKAEPAPIGKPKGSYKFIVKRGQDGLITEIEAKVE